MDMMGMIGYLTVYTVQDTSLRMGGDLILGRYIPLLDGWLHVVAYMFD